MHLTAANPTLLRHLWWTALGLLAVGVVAPVRPCTTFDLVGNGSIVYGRNFDYYAWDGRVMVNRRGLQKNVFGTGSGLQWVSRYGSLTFNQFGHEFPNGGINEAGLVVEHMLLDGSQYPSDSRPCLQELQWIQYQLDCSASVADVIASDQQVRIQPGSTPLHFLVADRTGRCATIEFLGGQLVCHTDSALPVAALTNDTYDTSLAYAATTSPDRADHVSSLGRFVQAAASVRNFTQSYVADPISYAFSALDNVNQPNWTRWSIVYDIGNMTAYFRTQPARSIKQIRLAALDFRPDAPIRMMDINSTTPGEVTPQLIYSEADNLAVLTSVYAQTTPLAYVTAASIQRRAVYPDSVIPISLPSIGAPPASQYVTPGSNVTFSVTATGYAPLSYQWKLNGTAITGATDASWTVANVQAGNMGFYSVTVGNIGGTTDSDVAILTVAAGSSRLVSLSTRGVAGAGASALTPGIALRGAGNKQLVIRGIGPTLGGPPPGGLGVPNTLSDPKLDVIPLGATTPVASNDDWGVNANVAALRAAMTAVGAFALGEGSRDAAVLTTVNTTVNNLYTVPVTPSDATVTPGIALAEVYDTEGATAPVQLVAVSTRGFTGPNEQVLTVGLWIGGDGPKQLLIRAVGPTLGAPSNNVPGVLADPQFRVIPAGKNFAVASNDNWSGTAALQAAFTQTGAFDLPVDSKDAAVIVRLPPGGYTVQATGVGDTTGNVLVEVYDLDP